MDLSEELDLVVREARSSDLTSLTANLAPDPGHDQLANRLREFESGYRSMLVAVLSGDPVATVSCQIVSLESGDAMRLFALDVGQRYRNLGIGTWLVTAVESRARVAGVPAVTLEVAVANAPAMRLYLRLGYLKIGDPFINRWERIDSSGATTVVEQSVRMRKELTV